MIEPYIIASYLIFMEAVLIVALALSAPLLGICSIYLTVKGLVTIAREKKLATVNLNRKERREKTRQRKLVQLG